MGELRRIGLRLKSIFRPARVERELREEILLHLELEIEKNLRAGMNEREARRKAMLDFGGVDRFQEQTRDARPTRPLEKVIADSRQAIRRLAKSPGFATVTVLTLAIGIGANSAIFSVVSGVLLHPLPFPESDDLVYINSYFAPESGYDFPDYAVGSPEYFDYKNQNRTMESVAAVSTEPINIVDGIGEPEIIRAGWVSPSMFTVLRTPAFLGRTLLEEDGGAEPSQVVVLSHAFWRRRFGADSTVVGRRISLGMEVSEEPILAEIVGVMPPGFGYPDLGIQLWGPMPLDPARTWRGGHWFDMMGRLAQGSSFEEAQTEMRAMMERWAITYPDHHVGHGLQMRPLLEEVVGDVKPALVLLLSSVGLVLLIACANVASLLLARAESRRREVAVRSALGAGRGRLLQQVLTESLLLSIMGGAFGLFLAWGGVKGLLGLEAGTIPRVEEIGLDGGVLLFTGGIVLITTLLFGMVPALREARPDPADTLRGAGARTTVDQKRIRFRQGIVVAEVAFGALLVVGAGLMIRSFQNLLDEDPGFETERLLFARFTLPAADYEPAGAVVFFDQLVERTKALPEVENAALTSRPPLLWEDQNGRFHIEGRPPAATAPMCCVASPVTVGADFFETLGISPLRGRVLGPDDHRAGGARSVVVDEAAAERWWPGEDPIGQRVTFAGEDAPWYSVVGVVENVTYDGPGEPWPTYYHSHNEATETMPFRALSSYLMVRTSGEPERLLPAIRQIVDDLNPSLAIAGSYSMEEVLDRAVAQPRFLMSVLSVFAVVALALSAIGIYGVMAYFVVLRSGEIGIRRALGAGDVSVVAMVLRQSLVLTGLGVSIGLVSALAWTRVLEAFLHDVSPTDPLTFLAVGSGVCVVAVLAAMVPARKASGVDPLEALKVE
ncbi:MAG: ABC transporter permease [Gemmatimonadota bacterium]|jgi:predicted permease